MKLTGWSVFEGRRAKDHDGRIISIASSAMMKKASISMYLRRESDGKHIRVEMSISEAENMVERLTTQIASAKEMEKPDVKLPDSIKNKNEALNYLKLLKEYGWTHDPCDPILEGMVWQPELCKVIPTREHEIKMSELNPQLFQIKDFDPYDYL